MICALLVPNWGWANAVTCEFGETSSLTPDTDQLNFVDSHLFYETQLDGIYELQESQDNPGVWMGLLFHGDAKQAIVVVEVREANKIQQVVVNIDGVSEILDCNSEGSL
jgi:hypothetical protein